MSDPNEPTARVTFILGTWFATGDEATVEESRIALEGTTPFRSPSMIGR